MSAISKTSVVAGLFAILGATAELRGVDIDFIDGGVPTTLTGAGTHSFTIRNKSCCGLRQVDFSALNGTYCHLAAVTWSWPGGCHTVEDEDTIHLLLFDPPIFPGEAGSFSVTVERDGGEGTIGVTVAPRTQGGVAYWCPGPGGSTRWDDCDNWLLGEEDNPHRLKGHLHVRPGATQWTRFSPRACALSQDQVITDYDDDANEMRFYSPSPGGYVYRFLGGTRLTLGYRLAVYDDATVIWSAGDLTTKSFVVGPTSTYRGNPTMTFNGGRWDSGTILVGYWRSDTGTLNIEAEVNASKGGDGYYPAAVTVGCEGTGNLNVTNGGYLSASAELAIAEKSTSVGNVTVSGAGSSILILGDTWPAQITVGRAGTGTLNVTDAGQVKPEWDLIIGMSGKGTAVVGGTDSLVDVFGDVGGGITVGMNVSGTLDVLDGGVARARRWVTIAEELEGQGTVRVSGEGSRLEAAYGDPWGWVDTPALIVGRKGHGKLVVEQGGAVDASYTTIGADVGGVLGEMTVSGPGSQLTTGGLTVGFAASGYLEVLNGGRVVADEGPMLARDWQIQRSLEPEFLSNTIAEVQRFRAVFGPSVAGGSMPAAYLRVDGSESSLEGGEAHVGEWGSAYAVVVNGGYVRTDGLDVGMMQYRALVPEFVIPPSQQAFVWVRGAGSRWEVEPGSGLLKVSSPFEPGDLAALLISDGGLVTTGHAQVGRTWKTSEPDGEGGFKEVWWFYPGRVLVTGAGSMWTIFHNLQLAGPPSDVDVVSGGTMVVTGMIEVKGYNLIQRSELFIGPGSYVNAGTVAIGEGGMVMSCGLLEADTIVVQHGYLVGNSGTVRGNVINVEGVVGPGLSPGSLTIDGEFTQEAEGTLEIEIGGTDPNRHDLLTVTGTARLGGTLNIKRAGGAEFNVGDTFNCVQFAAREGDFGTVVIPTLPTGEPIFQVHQEAGGISMTALVDLRACIADLDLDDDADGFDFLTFANCFNGAGRTPLAACENPKADLDKDGDVDGIDFATFANCYNGSDNPPRCP